MVSSHAVLFYFAQVLRHQSEICAATHILKLNVILFVITALQFHLKKIQRQHLFQESVSLIISG